MIGADSRRTDSVEATERLGEALAPALRAGDVVVLQGDLGAGKTRFVAGLARGLDPGARVRSPSFTLVNEYRSRTGGLTLYHLDLYRLGTGEVDGLGLEEYAELGALAVEWGDRLPAAWSEDALTLAFDVQADDARVISGAASRGRGLELLAAWRAIPERA
ncbi:MAG: tRNA (adenosine(37)-N6)-threonylcarbamoyltransferase complex ATPase subunit type 1 TsaE [Candidatus Eisenbacteria bacterium]|uniref:tRNA threonylcarbamoyladenosine biosynthesis protein TsaE n=1 Tax=Eiseniibacteriota bacterium TaxID=2212470 RepID=A0A933SE45_UNCEI|nr:tRNA (adenosine(37)-N6)-threonylcarbamoyltransferase complex ATPase subunit type 1 TsaE [Candidatus Eisenbacteria bacterium]